MVEVAKSRLVYSELDVEMEALVMVETKVRVMRRPEDVRACCVVERYVEVKVTSWIDVCKIDQLANYF